MPNAIDKAILNLAELWNGYGMLLYIFVITLISAVLSAMIGLERYRRGENAGIRTHALLAIGCSFLMAISIWAIRLAVPVDSTHYDYDVSRIAAGAVTGIGFLGAGVIIKDKFTVKGLSTATTLWICAAIGLATGAGYVLEACVATAITLGIVFIRNRTIVFIDRNAPHVIIEAKSGYPIIEKVSDCGAKNSMNIKTIDITHFDNEKVSAKAYFPYHTNPLLLDYFCNEIKKDEAILSTIVVMKRSNKNYEGPHES